MENLQKLYYTSIIHFFNVKKNFSLFLMDKLQLPVPVTATRWQSCCSI